MDQDTPPNQVKVTAEDGTPLPFTLRDRTLDFFSGTPGSVRVVAGDREYVYSLTLPQLWDSKWEPPADAGKGIPRFAPALEGSSDMWPWLAVLGGLGLVVEWMLYGRFRRGRFALGPMLLRRRSTTAAEGRR
jgi:hypothetical protein